MERTISRNPTTAEVRLHCLDLAVRGAQLLGRGDAILMVGDQYFDWVMKGTQPTPPKMEEQPGGGADDDVGPISEGAAGGAGGADGEGRPPSLKQAQAKAK